LLNGFRHSLGALLSSSLLLLLFPLPAAAFDASEQLQLADGLYLRGMYDFALREYLTLVREGAGFDQMDAAIFRAAECHRQLGDKKSADEFYQRVIRDFPGSAYRVRADLRRAELLVAAQRYADALPMLTGVLERNPPVDLAASAWYYRGYVEKRTGVSGAAESSFRKVIGGFTDSPFASYARLELAELLLERGGFESEARSLYEEVTRQPATPRLEAEAWFQLAELSYRAKRYHESADSYARLLEKFPSDRRAGEARLQAAWSYHHDRRFEPALSLAQAELARPDGEDQDLWLYLKANCERQMGRAEDADASYAEILRGFKDSPVAAPARYERALMAFQRGAPETVIKQMEGLDLKGSGSEEDMLWLLAESYSSLQQPARALDYYRKLAEEHAAGDKAPLAFFRTATIHQEAGEFAEASEGFRGLAEKYPGHELAADALFASAYCRARLQEHRQALADWKRLLDLAPDYPKADEAWYQKALAEMQSEKEKEAQTSLRRLLKDHPDSVRRGDAHHWLAILLENDGRFDAAEKELRAAIAQLDDATELRKLKFRLVTVLQKQDKLDESTAVLEEVVKEEAGDVPPALLEWLARRQLEEDRLEQAASTAQALAEVGDTSAWQQIGWYLRGVALAKQGKPEKSLDAFERAARLDARTREGAEAALQAGQAHLEAGRTEQARTFFEMAGDRSQTGELVDIRARSYAGLGRVSEAEQNWDEASRYFMGVAILFDDPELTPECLYRASEAFAKLGREEDQRRTLKELRTRYPESKWTTGQPDH